MVGLWCSKFDLLPGKCYKPSGEAKWFNQLTAKFTLVNAVSMNPYHSSLLKLETAYTCTYNDSELSIVKVLGQWLPVYTKNCLHRQLNHNEVSTVQDECLLSLTKEPNQC